MADDAACETCGRALPIGKQGRCAPCKRVETLERRRRVTDGTATPEDLAINGYTVQRRPQRSRVMMTCRVCGESFARVAHSRGANMGTQYRCQTCYIRGRWGNSTRVDPGSRGVLTVRVDKGLLNAVKDQAKAAQMALSPFIEQVLAQHMKGARG